MKVFWNRPQYKTSNELRDRKFEAHRNLSAAQKRKLIKICVVDDQVFTPRANLENLGYQIESLGDIASVSRVQKFQIVLCDLQGVGTALDAKKQGAFLIREIKRNYPEKFVIAYTGGGLNAVISREASTDADHLLKKDADIDDWVDVLDGIIGRLLNPYQVWQRQREALVAREIDTLTILKLENAFVESFSGKPHTSGAFEKFVSSEKR
jgi:ActR/RegA family two-component response regulator